MASWETGSTSRRRAARERRRSPAQHLGVEPLAARPAGAKLALDDAAGRLPGGPGSGRPRPPRPSRRAGSSGRTARGCGRSGPAGRPHRVGHRLQERLRDSDRQGGPRPSRSPTTSSIATRSWPATAATRPAGALQLGQPAGDGRRVGAAGGLLHGEVAEQPQGVVQAVGVAGLALGGEQLQLQLQVGQGGLVDQVLGFSRPAARPGPTGPATAPGPAARPGGVALVHERGHVPELEQLANGDRNRVSTSTTRTSRLATWAISSLRPGRSKTSWRALAHRLQHHRERPHCLGRPEQSQRCAGAYRRLRACAGRGGAGAAAGPGPRTRGSGWRTGPSPTSPTTRSSTSSGSNRIDSAAGASSTSGAHHHPVVGVHGLDLQAQPLPDPGLDGLGPGSMHLGAEGRVDADPPVAQLVAEALDDGAVVGQDPGGLALLVQVGGQVPGGEVVQRPPAAAPAASRRSGRRARANAPRARPSSTGRPSMSRARTAACPAGRGPGRPARSWVMSSIHSWRRRG